MITSPKHIYIGFLLSCIVLMCILLGHVLSTFFSRKSVPSTDALSMATGCGLLAIISTLLYMIVGRCCTSPKQNGQIVEGSILCVWALVPCQEAIHWRQSSHKKPEMKFEEHVVSFEMDYTRNPDLEAPEAIQYNMHLDVEAPEVSQYNVQVDVEAPEAIHSSTYPNTMTVMPDTPGRTAHSLPAGAGSQLGDVEDAPRRFTTGRAEPSSPTSSTCICCLRDVEATEVVAMLRCGHFFCEACIKAWVVRKPSCPVCRSTVLA